MRLEACGRFVPWLECSLTVYYVQLLLEQWLTMPWDVVVSAGGRGKALCARRPVQGMKARRWK